MKVIVTSSGWSLVAILNERGILGNNFFFFFDKTDFWGNGQNFGDSGSTSIFRQNLPTKAVKLSYN